MHSASTASVSVIVETPKERKKRILRKFRAIVHLVMVNLYWIGDPDDTKISDNVKRNIRLLLRRKKVKSVLTMREKAILSKPKNLRTEEEKIILAKCISGLQCFRKYPSVVKEKLAGITNFVYYPPGRHVIKQDHAPTAMYFILLGECAVTKSRFDQVLDETITEEIGTLGPGMMFGEVALLHGSGRLATITTTTHCEFLKIKKEDFDEVLKETVAKSWANIQTVLDQFSCFKNWDVITKRECCIISKTRHFEPDETILGDGVGLTNYVYFITEGSCTIIEDLTVRVYNKRGRINYSLSDLSETASNISEMDVSRIFRKYYKDDDLASRISGRSSYIKTTNRGSIARSKGPSTTSDLLAISAFKDPSAIAAISTSSHASSQLPLTREQSSNVSAGGSETIKKSSSWMIGVQFHQNYDLETRFIQLCDLHTGACFNLGESLKRRRVVSLTPVNCLLIPQYFIYRNNKDNIWNMVKQFLTNHIPNTEKVFKQFVQQQKFKKYRKELVTHLLEEKMVSNDNSIHNVPYSIRLRDGVDTKYF